jgi:signal transduction histidine kinase
MGVVGASVNLLRLQEGMRRAELPANSSVLIVDQQGRIVARRTAPEEWVGKPALDSPAVREALRGREGVSEGDFVDGVRRLSGFAGAHRVPWEVIVGIPSDEAYGALRRELLRWLARVLVAGAMTAALTWLLGRRLTRPMLRLANAVRTYAAGDLAHRVRPAGPEEIASLGATFNAMAEALQRQMDDLQAAQQREREAGARSLAELRRLHSEFIAVAAHELRTPVAAAKSYAELLLRDDVDLPAAVRHQALVRLDAVCERLARLVRSLLGASRIQAGRLEVQRAPVDLAALAARVVDDFSAYTPTHEVRLTTNSPKSLVLSPESEALPQMDGDSAGFGRHDLGLKTQDLGLVGLVVLGDAERIEDVLVNLLANAAKYSPDGTPIVVRLVALGANVDVEVEDQGPGIPPEEQQAVFERFRRGRGVAASGVGLGLYIAQAYVQAMGGEIGVRSAPGHGATFWFSLPAVAPGRASDRPGPDAEPSAAHENGGQAAVALGLVP